MLRTIFFAFLLLCILPQSARADEFPTRPIRLVVPFPAGSATDAMTRFLSEKVTKALKQSFIIDNRPGAQGAIAAQEVARAAPDGYTLLVGTNSTQAANVYLFKNLSYDPKRDFAGITQFAINPLVLVINANNPAHTLKDFLAEARSKPGGLNFGVGNTGSLVTAAKLMASANFSAVAVNYPGSPQAIVDLLAGRLDFMITDVSVTRPYIESGKLRALAVTTAQRVPALPGVPTMSEAGVQGYQFAAWGGLFAPAKTPKSRINLLNSVFSAAIDSPQGRAFFEQQGQLGTPMTPSAYDAFVLQEIDTWAQMLAQAGVERQ